jgi:hypothetical protein
MLAKTIAILMLGMMLSGCALMLAGGGGYVVGREMEEDQGVNEPEVYK